MRIAGAGRYFEDDAAGRLAPPGMRERGDVGTLCRVEAAAVCADQQFDVALAFLDGDRVALAVVEVRGIGSSDLARLHAAAEQQRAADDRGQGQRAQASAAQLRVGFIRAHHRGFLVATLSRG
jgi:hypothetical protein